MELKKVYQIDKWTDWHHTIAGAIDDFVTTFSYHPNIIQANEHTFSQFDYLVNVVPGEKDNLGVVMDDIADEIRIADDDEYATLGGFVHPLADLDFATDNQLHDKNFRLIYDDEPEWNDAETLVDEPVEELELINS